MVAERKLREVEREMESLEKNGLYFSFEQFLAHKRQQDADAAPRRKRMREDFQKKWDAKVKREAAERATATPQPTTRSRRARHG